jgi:hypothetical protein
MQINALFLPPPSLIYTHRDDNFQLMNGMSGDEGDRLRGFHHWNTFVEPGRMVVKRTAFTYQMVPARFR